MTVLGLSLSELASLAAVAQTAVVVLAVVYAVRQVHEARRAREATIVMTVFDRLHSLEASDRRHRLYSEIADAWPVLSEEQDAIVRETINEFDLLAYLVEQRLISFGTVAGLYYGTTLRVWEAAEPYILQQRTRRGTRYAQYFERMVEQCREYIADDRPAERARSLRRVGESPSDVC